MFVFPCSTVFMFSCCFSCILCHLEDFLFFFSVYDSDSSDPVTGKKAAEGVPPREQARDF